MVVGHVTQVEDVLCLSPQHITDTDWLHIERFGNLCSRIGRVSFADIGFLCQLLRQQEINNCHQCASTRLPRGPPSDPWVPPGHPWPHYCRPMGRKAHPWPHEHSQGPHLGPKDAHSPPNEVPWGPSGHPWDRMAF